MTLADGCVGAEEVGVGHGADDLEQTNEQAVVVRGADVKAIERPIVRCILLGPFEADFRRVGRDIETAGPMDNEDILAVVRLPQDAVWGCWWDLATGAQSDIGRRPNGGAACRPGACARMIFSEMRRWARLPTNRSSASICS